MRTADGIPYLTDHRMPLGEMVSMGPTQGEPWAVVGTIIDGRFYPGKLAVLFADRGMVREGCDCDYCTWEPG